MDKVTQVLQRPDGSEVRIVAQKVYDVLRAKPVVSYFVQKRETPEVDWRTLSSTPAPGWREMPRAEYLKHGRSEVFQAVSHGEIFKVCQMLH